jgi:osmoprotectant transport system substrate-binding protein
VGGPLTLSALVNDQVQVANLFSTDPAIAENDLVVLEDVKNLFSAQNIVPVIATPKVSDVVTKTLDAVSAALTTTDLVVMNGRLANHDSFDAVVGELTGIFADCLESVNSQFAISCRDEALRPYRCHDF